MQQMNPFTIDDLKRLMRECAGADETVNLDDEIGDRSFDELGYDSLALLETASRVERAFGVSLPDDVLGGVDTPSAFVAFVNGRFPAKAEA